MHDIISVHRDYNTTGKKSKPESIKKNQNPVLNTYDDLLSSRKIKRAK